MGHEGLQGWVVDWWWCEERVGGGGGAISRLWENVCRRYYAHTQHFMYMLLVIRGMFGNFYNRFFSVRILATSNGKVQQTS